MMILAPAAPPTGVSIAVDGEGSLRFAKAGALVYAKRATLRAANGALVNEAGLPLVPKIAVSGRFVVGLDGTVTCAGKTAGRIVLAKVANGRAALMNPGEGLAGVIRTVAAPNPVAVAAPVVARPVAKTSPKVAPKAVASAVAARISIDVRAESQIDGERILLGSVAEIVAPSEIKRRLAALDLGKLPPFGTSRTIGAGYVRALVRGAGLEADGFDLAVPVGATARRSGVVVEAQTILDEATKGIDGYVPGARPVAPMTVPAGALTLSTATTRGATGVSVVVTANVDGQPVATRTVALVPDPSVPTVKVGEAVRLRLISGGATIEVPGKIKTAGRQGSDVTVVTATGSVHTGRLLPNGLVEVKL